MKTKLIKAFRKLEQKLFPDHFYVISELMAQELSESNLVVTDVGAAYGVDSRWQPVENLTQFVTFEPDSRSQNYATTIKTINFATGLSNEQGKKPLYLTKFPPASSLYPLNMEQLQYFANRELHEVIGSTLIELDTLDNCLANRPDLQPDFLKVDAEGADLDVLKGALNSLENSIMGLQIEVSFIERHKKAAFFSETDAFLREQGFALFILSREHWLRHNLVYGANSHPQLIWGDAVYFLNKDKLLEKVKSVELNKQTALLVKFLVILLSYGSHDYAIEIVDNVLSENLISETTAQDFKKAIMNSIISPISYVIRYLVGVILLSVLYLIPLPIRDRRKRTAFYLKKYTIKLSYYLLTNTSRKGIYNSCISDEI